MNRPGNRAAKYRRLSRADIYSDDGDEVEFVTLFDSTSIEAVKEFAGQDRSKPVIYPKAEALLKRMDERSQHYRIIISR